MEKSKVYLIALFYFLFPFTLCAQQENYFIFLKDKNNSSYTLDDPSQFLSFRAIARRIKYQIPITTEDLPVSPAYVNAIKATGATIVYTSKWLNGALLSATPAQLLTIQQLSFVLNSTRLYRVGQATLKSGNQSIAMSTSNASMLQAQSSYNYGASLNQMNMIGVDQMHDDGFTGKGKLIAVIDDGFLNVNTISTFDSLFAFNRIKGTYDFVHNDSGVYDEGIGHGTEVLSLLAAFTPGSLIGTAWQADYLLLKSEDNFSESLLEEYNWLRAAEYADSAGADMITSSLGYNYFDNSSENHSYADLNGDKTVITQAADFAASKGILVLNAAGNEGNSNWKYLLAPADADSVLAIGGVRPTAVHFSSSSYGPSYDGRIKPDLVAQGSQVLVIASSGSVTYKSGTSYATPMVAGLAAGLWQAHPDMSNMELIYHLKRSANRFANPDNTYGYGIPNYNSFGQLIATSNFDQIFVYPVPVESDPLCLSIPEESIGKSGLVCIYNSNGKLVANTQIASMDISNPLYLNFENWSAGIYILTLRTDSNYYKLKLIKV